MSISGHCWQCGGEHEIQFSCEVLQARFRRWHLFWTQIVIYSLMLFISKDKHVFCCDGESIDAIPCDRCGAGY